MKKIITLIIIFVSMTCFSFATTGGPDFIKYAYYDSKHHSIWYIREYYDGNGGGIKVVEYMIKSHSTKMITNMAGIQYESDDGERIYNITSEEAQKILIKKGFKELQPVHIDKMPLYFTLTPYHYEIYRDDLTTYVSNTPKNSMYRANRRNKVYVNHQLQNITNITTCGLDPINYRGLSLPGVNFLAIIASSERRDCDEGGYIGEELFVVRYVRMYKNYFIGPHSDLYRKILEDSGENPDREDHMHYDGPIKASIGGLYTNRLKYNKENIINKR